MYIAQLPVRNSFRGARTIRVSHLFHETRRNACRRIHRLRARPCTQPPSTIVLHVYFWLGWLRGPRLPPPLPPAADFVLMHAEPRHVAEGRASGVCPSSGSRRRIHVPRERSASLMRLRWFNK